MEELVADGVVGAHDESESALRTNEARGALKESSAQCMNFLEDPAGRALLGGIAMGERLGLHLQLSGEVVGEDGGAEVELIADASADRDVIHLALALTNQSVV